MVGRETLVETHLSIIQQRRVYKQQATEGKKNKKKRVEGFGFVSVSGERTRARAMDMKQLARRFWLQSDGCLLARAKGVSQSVRLQFCSFWPAGQEMRNCRQCAQCVNAASCLIGPAASLDWTCSCFFISVPNWPPPPKPHISTTRPGPRSQTCVSAAAAL